MVYVPGFYRFYGGNALDSPDTPNTGLMGNYAYLALRAGVGEYQEYRYEQEQQERNRQRHENNLMLGAFLGGASEVERTQLTRRLRRVRRRIKDLQNAEPENPYGMTMQSGAEYSYAGNNTFRPKTEWDMIQQVAFEEKTRLRLEKLQRYTAARDKASGVYFASFSQESADASLRSSLSAAEYADYKANFEPGMNNRDNYNFSDMLSGMQNVYHRTMSSSFMNAALSPFVAMRNGIGLGTAYDQLSGQNRSAARAHFELQRNQGFGIISSGHLTDNQAIVQYAARGDMNRQGEIFGEALRFGGEMLLMGPMFRAAGLAGRAALGAFGNTRMGAATFRFGSAAMQRIRDPFGFTAIGEAGFARGFSAANRGIGFRSLTGANRNPALSPNWRPGLTSGNEGSMRALFRGDSRSPQSVFQNGFSAKGGTNNLYEHAAYHRPSNFVSTSASPTISRTRFIPEQGGYVYTIRTSRPGINVNMELIMEGKTPPFMDELEFVFRNRIAPSELYGARWVDPTKSFNGPFIKNPYWTGGL